MMFWEWYLEPWIEEWWKKDIAVDVTSVSPTSELFRPEDFKEYVGQEKAKALINAYILGTVSRNRTFPHTLIHGHAGCGKTALAHIIARELNKPSTECVASEISSSYDLIGKIQANLNGIIFIDEIHALDRNTVESIYTLMEEFRYNDQTIPQFTLIGATTEIGEIIANRRPFYDRFKIIIELEQYKIEEMEAIVKQYKERTFPEDELASENYSIIASNCRLTPRHAIRLLESTIYLGGDVNKSLNAHGIIKDGYTEKDLAVLEYIALNDKGVGLNGLASYLGTSTQNYTHEIEPYLLQNKLVLRTSRGRKISELGLKKILELKEI